MPTYKRIFGISDLVEEYEVFIISVFGVLHDRTSLIPGARKCLEKLRDHEKTILILSNAPRRVSTVIQQLSQIGIPPSLYQYILTSGEETYRHLSQRFDPWHATLGKYCFYLGSTEDDDLIEDLEIYPVSDIHRANFILAVGYDIWHKDIDYYDKILKQAVALRLPMVCANPDEYIIDKGEKFLRAGSLAKLYQEYGGQVRYHGKPYQSFYQQALLRLKKFSQRQILAIGDSLETDILGGTFSGLNTLFLTRNLQAYHFGLNEREECPKEQLDKIFEEFNLEPNYVLKHLMW